MSLLTETNKVIDSDGVCVTCDSLDKNVMVDLSVYILKMNKVLVNVIK